MALNQTQVARLFEFLKVNRSWNETFQHDEYRRALAYCGDPLRRLTQLLHTAANTQSSPRLGKLGMFWRELSTFSSHGRPGLVDVTEHFEKQAGMPQRGNGPWERLFHALAAQPGWGPKTSALFVKSAIEVHRGPKSLHFLRDAKVAQTLHEDDEVYLPVDAVITHIFRSLGLERVNFQSVNKALFEMYTADEMLIWDDLWYWGFFTQVSDGTNRTFGWNQDKFWCQIVSPKAQEAEVRRLGEQFVRICRGGRARS